MQLVNAYKLIADKLALWLKELIRLLPNIALAALLLVIGFVVAKWLRKLSGKVKDITLDAVKEIAGLSDDEITLFYRSFAESSINFTIRLWVNTPEQIDFLQVQSEAIIRIKKAYDVNGISIPFPIRTLDFSMGGINDIKEANTNMKSNDI